MQIAALLLLLSPNSTEMEAAAETTGCLKTPWTVIITSKLLSSKELTLTDIFYQHPKCILLYIIFSMQYSYELWFWVFLLSVYYITSAVCLTYLSHCLTTVVLVVVSDSLPLVDCRFRFISALHLLALDLYFLPSVRDNVTNLTVSLHSGESNLLVTGLIVLPLLLSS